MIRTIDKPRPGSEYAPCRECMNVWVSNRSGVCRECSGRICKGCRNIYYPSARRHKAFIDFCEPCAQPRRQKTTATAGMIGEDL